MTDEARMLTSAEVAKRLACNAETVRALIACGRLAAANISPHKRRATWRIAPADVDLFLAGASATVPAAQSRVARARRKPAAPAGRDYFPQFKG